MGFSNKEGIYIVKKIVEEIIQNRNYLSEIDAAVGDGDHGINMSKGFTLAKEEMADADINMSEGFMIISKILVRKIGGSMGPLYGNFFRGLSIVSRDKEIIDKAVLKDMLKTAYNNIKVVSTAEVGDKTLIDVLDPALKTYEEVFNKGGSLEECLNNMVKAAIKGLESTKNLVAKVGRGSRLGNRSLGHQDAGATSCFIILKALSEASIQMENNNQN